jgi:putative transposase
MAKPSRNANPDAILNPTRTFFATAKASMGRRLLQSERNATLLIDVLRSCVAERKFELHDFVIMPDHIHLLITINADETVERAMQFIKGRFSYRIKKEFGYEGEVWQRGYSEAQADSRQTFSSYQQYIAQNPVKAGLAASSSEYPYCYTHLAQKKRQDSKQRKE